MALSQGIDHCQSPIEHCFAGGMVKLPAKQLAMANWQWSIGPALLGLTQWH
jgi:hypothetical protein